MIHTEDGVAKVCIKSSSDWEAPAVPQMLNQRGAQHAYPSTTTDFVKLLREAGLTVEFVEGPEQRRVRPRTAAPSESLPVLLTSNRECSLICA